jgi:hypothetical protein
MAKLEVNKTVDYELVYCKPSRLVYSKLTPLSIYTVVGILCLSTELISIVELKEVLRLHVHKMFPMSACISNSDLKI